VNERVNIDMRAIVYFVRAGRVCPLKVFITNAYQSVEN